MAWYQMALGITNPVLEYTKNSLSHINSIWTNDFILCSKSKKSHSKLKRPCDFISKMTSNNIFRSRSR